MYERVHVIVCTLAAHYFNKSGSIQAYSRRPTFPDREVIALAITAECLECDSENLLLSKLAGGLPRLPHSPRPHSANYNRRHRRHTLINNINAHIAACVDLDDEGLVIDSMSLPTVEPKRDNSSRACRDPRNDAVLADKT